VYGHLLNVPEAVIGRRVAKFKFQDLCEEMLGAADFIDLGRNFRVVFLEGLPYLDLTSKNELRRLITLVDALYESKTLLFVLSEGPPLEILKLTEAEKKSSSFDEVFAFDRTLSRLLEMQSTPYVDAWSKSFVTGEEFLTNIFKSDSNIEQALNLFKDAEEKSGHCGSARANLAVLGCLSDAQLKQIYSEYNWGLDGDNDILTDAVFVLADDVRQLTGLPFPVQGKRNCTNDISSGDSMSYRQFVELIRK
jgi:hypothetical protein